MRSALPHPSVVYEVVIDRFCRSRAPDVAADEVARWGREQGDSARFGGDLQGVASRLDHLVSLGVDTLLLSPVWPSTSAIGDSIEDYFTVSPELGGEAGFEELIAAAKARGLWVVLTGLFDRVGRQHDWFVEGTQQDVDDGRVDPSLRRRSFFRFDTQPYGHAAFRGDPKLPELNLQDHHLRHKLFHGDRSVVRTWIERGIDGWRIDHAESLGYDVLHEILRATRSVDPDCLVIGDTRAFSAREVRDGIVDGVVNHYLREAQVAFLRGRIPAAELSRLFEQQLGRYGGRGLARCFNPLSSVGDPRLLTLLDGDTRRMRLAATLQFLLPGAAMIFYGDETGTCGEDCIAGCQPSCWDESSWDRELLDTYRALGQLRRSQRALTSGDVALLTAACSVELFALARYTKTPRETVVAAINRGDQPCPAQLFVPVGGLVDGLPMVDVFSGQQSAFRNGALEVEVPACGAVVMVPEPDAVPGYTFIKDR